MLISLSQARENRKNYFQHFHVWPFNYTCTHHMQQLTCVALVSLTLFDVQSYVLDVSDSSWTVLSGNYIMKSFCSQTVGMGMYKGSRELDISTWVRIIWVRNIHEMLLCYLKVLWLWFHNSQLKWLVHNIKVFTDHWLVRLTTVRSCSSPFPPLQTGSKKLSFINKLCQFAPNTFNWFHTSILFAKLSTVIYLTNQIMIHKGTCTMEQRHRKTKECQTKLSSTPLTRCN